jgi:DNA-directed RNA polymerase specialized sigma24 family protein
MTDDGQDDGQNADGPHGVYGAMHAHLVTTRDPSRPSPEPGPPLSTAPSRLSAAPTPGETPPAGARPTTGEHAAVVDGFSDFYRTTWPGVARALAVALGDRDLAVDATDEAMARAYPRWATLSGYDNPGAWVYRVGLNWARSHRRRLARRLPFAHPTEVPPVPVADPAVRDALLALPLKLRSVVVCRLLLDWSVDDTATALGVRPGTVQSRLHRAVRSLHASLDHLR